MFFVEGVPSCVSFGGIQLVWHLAELASEKLVRLLFMSSLAINLQQSGSSATQCSVDFGRPTVRGLGSEARFQVKKSACFWCHGRYRE